MKKTKTYDRVFFKPPALQDLLRTFERVVREAAITAGLDGDQLDSAARVTLGAFNKGANIEIDGAKWELPTEAEFMAAYRRAPEDGTPFSIFPRSDLGSLGIWKENQWSGVVVTVEMPTAEQIETIFEIAERAAEQGALPEVEYPPARAPVVFIGHGRSDQWRQLKDHLQDHQGFTVEAYETGTRAGHTIRDILEDMLHRASFALLVMTAEDEQVDGDMRARQNVIHEAGLFQGRLGFHRAIVVREQGVETFSNIDGIQRIEFSPSNIREAFGDVVATLRREFPER